MEPANASGQQRIAGKNRLSLPAPPNGTRSLPDWIPHAILLSSLLSLAAHGVLLLIFAITLRSCDKAPVGFGKEESREVGIVMKEVGDNPNAVVPGEAKELSPTCWSSPLLPKTR